MKTLILSLFFILSAQAQDSSLNGAFGTNCVQTFRGLQCNDILEISYNDDIFKLKTFGLNSGRTVVQYEGKNPNHEIYWVTENRHVIMTKRYIRQQQQQQQSSQYQQSHQTQQKPQQCQQQQCQQPQHAQQSPIQTQQYAIECQTVTEIILSEDGLRVTYDNGTSCSDGSTDYDFGLTLLERI